MEILYPTISLSRRCFLGEDEGERSGGWYCAGSSFLFEIQEDAQSESNLLSTHSPILCNKVMCWGNRRRREGRVPELIWIISALQYRTHTCQDTGFLLENSDQIFYPLGSLEASEYNSQPLHYKWN